MKLRSIRSVRRLEGKRVLVRVDANVPVEDGAVVDGPYGRIAQVAPGIRWLMDRGARVILAAHIGRPDGKRDRRFSMAPVAKRFGELLDAPILYNGSIVGKDARAMVDRLLPGRVALLENLRFDPREEKNDPAFAAALAELAHLYVNDAFGVSHRAHASVAAIQKELPSFAGFTLMREIDTLDTVMKKPKQPFVLLMGGAKMETKIGVLERLAPKARVVLIGGALATTFLAAQGKKVGRSLYEKKSFPVARKLLTRYEKKIRLPEDVRVVTDPKRDRAPRNVSVDAVKAREMVVDIGSRTMRGYARELLSAKTIVWNGPLGLCEEPPFCESTRLVARAIASTKAMSVIGGGDSVPVVESLGLADRFTLVSTGGGAMLAFLAGEKLPGVEPLIVK